MPGPRPGWARARLRHWVTCGDTQENWDQPLQGWGTKTPQLARLTWVTWHAQIMNIICTTSLRCWIKLLLILKEPSVMQPCRIQSRIVRWTFSLVWTVSLCVLCSYIIHLYLSCLKLINTEWWYSSKDTLTTYIHASYVNVKHQCIMMYVLHCTVCCTVWHDLLKLENVFVFISSMFWFTLDTSCCAIYAVFIILRATNTRKHLSSPKTPWRVPVETFGRW